MTLPPAYFEAMYADSADPWGFALRWLERRKYALTLAACGDQLASGSAGHGWLR